jgi:hypothetical protein
MWLAEDWEVSLLAALLFFSGAVVTLVCGLIALGELRRAEPRPSGAVRLGVLATTGIAGAIIGGLGGYAALFLVGSFARGRQLRRFGRVLLPAVEPGEGFSGLRLCPSVPESEREGMARQWRENGRTEHASVAAFARLTNELMALGAPAKLLEDAQQDAKDEVRHTELCFSLARALDGVAMRPAAFPVGTGARRQWGGRRFALARLAVDSLVDGALHEGVSARVVAKLAQRCEDPEIRGVLKTIAADEGRHCAHGWDVVEWCLGEGGWPVAAALRGALRRLPGTMIYSLPQTARDGSWEQFGIHGEALEAAEYAKALDALTARVERMISPRFTEAESQRTA